MNRSSISFSWSDSVRVTGIILARIRATKWRLKTVSAPTGVCLLSTRKIDGRHGGGVVWPPFRRILTACWSVLAPITCGYGP